MRPLKGWGRGGQGTGRTYAHHRGAPPGFPTGNLERCCPSLSQEEPCPPAQNMRAHVSSDPGNNQSSEGGEDRYTGKKIHQKPQNTLGKRSTLCSFLHSTAKKPPQWLPLVLLYLRGQGIIHQNVGASGIRAKSPDGTCSQQIPIVLGLEEFSQFLPGGKEETMEASGSSTMPSWRTVCFPGWVALETGRAACGASSPFSLVTIATFSPVPRDLDHLVLYVLGKSLLKRLSNHGDLVPSHEGHG